MAAFVLLASGSFLRASTIARDWTAEDKEVWKKAVKRVVTTPPCCGACSLLGMNEGRKAYKHITGEDRSSEAEKIYNDHEKKLVEAFRYFNPSRYEYWFGSPSKENANNGK
jgi:hypothetical protein